MISADDPITESAKATQAVAQTTEKALDLAQRFGGFIAQYVAGPLEQGVGIFEDKLRYMRWERQIRLMDRANNFIKGLGLDAPTKPIPLKLAVPLFQAASLEDDDSLQDRWAKLLVNSSVVDREIDLTRSYIDILERISPLDAAILDTIYSLDAVRLHRHAVLTDRLPDVAILKDEEGSPDERVLPSEEIILALANLSRLDCIKLPTAWGGGEIFAEVYTTVIGRSFVRACTLDLNPPDEKE